MLNICEFSIAMHRGGKTMQKYLDFTGVGEFQKVQEDRPCNGNSQKFNARQDLFCRKDNLHMLSNDNGVKKRK